MKKQKVFTKSRSTARTFNGRAKIDQMYDRDWSAYRLRFLEVNKYCYSCHTFAEIVDHLEPHAGRLEFFWKEDNYIPLCKRCHDTVTARFDRYYVKGKPITKKLVWLSDQRIRNDHFSKVRVVPFGPELQLNIAKKKGALMGPSSNIIQ